MRTTGIRVSIAGLVASLWLASAPAVAQQVEVFEPAPPDTPTADGEIPKPTLRAT